MPSMNWPEGGIKTERKIKWRVFSHWVLVLPCSGAPDFWNNEFYPVWASKLTLAYAPTATLALAEPNAVQPR